MMYKHVRWCFNVGKWTPTRKDWLKLTASVSDEELTRINRFHYQDDSKSSIIGRALIRKFVSLAFGMPSNDIDLDRTSLGRPIIRPESLDRLASKLPTSFDFNVSHSGDYCVLAGFWSHDPAAANSKLTVGIDVTKIVAKKTRHELDRFLYLMSKREFLPEEWETVTRVTGDRQKCINFTRLWCLKESFIKSIGLGLSFKLDRICFRTGDQLKYNLDPEQLKGRPPLNDTRVLIDNQLASDWSFLETALDDEHLVAIGYNYPGLSSNERLDLEGLFLELDIETLLEGITPIRTKDNDSNWTLFSSKAIKTKF